MRDIKLTLSEFVRIMMHIRLTQNVRLYDINHDLYLDYFTTYDGADKRITITTVSIWSKL